MSAGQENLVRNPSFEEGDDGPAHWRLSAPPGAWETEGRTGDRCVSVESADPQHSNSWGQAGVGVRPFTTYRFSFFARTAPGTTGGCIISGPDFANRDTNVGAQWERRSHVFVTRPDQSEMLVRVGQWNKVGTVFFDDIAVQPVAPVHRTVGETTLGVGESVADGEYKFTAPLSEEGANYSRALESFNAGFNSNRWVFGPGAWVTYRHEVAGVAQTGAVVRPRIGYYQSGHCIVEASRDGERWVQIGRLSGLEQGEFAVPGELLPAPAVYIRLRSPGQVEAREDSHPGAFQIHGYEYSSTLAAGLPDMMGSTRYLDIETADPRIALEVLDLGSALPGGDNVARLVLRSTADEPLALAVSLEVAPAEAAEVGPAARAQVTVPARGEAPVELAYDVPDAGDWVLRLVVLEGERTLLAAATEFSVPSLYAAGYGYPLGADDDAQLWWCEAPYKVSRERPAPGGEARPVRIFAARNEYEPFQVVLRPTRDLTGLSAVASALTGPNGATISADNVEVCHVWYHYVSHPTDKEGCVGWWPDALPPLDEPIDLTAGENQPLWVTVRVPEEAAAGEYRGTLALSAEGWSATVPVELRVWDFALPEESSVVSAFGLSQGTIWRYHNLSDEADRERVWDLYMQNFRDHRISPYSFWRRGIQADFGGFQWEGGRVVQDDPFEGENCLEIVDDSDTHSIAAQAAQRITVDPAARHELSFAAKTAEPNQRYLVTFLSYDEAGEWISGHNLDLSFTGTGQWRRESLAFVPQDRSPRARSLRLVLRPVPWSEDGRDTGTAWFDDIRLVREGTDENLIGDGGFEQGAEAVQVTVDFSEWDRYAEKYLDGYRFNSFRLPLAGMGGGTFHARHGGRIGPFEQGTPEYRRLFRDYCMAVQNHLEEKGWLDKAYIYWFDEPSPDDYEFVREGMEEIKRAGPKLQRMLTEQPVEPLFGAVDIWCPVLHNFDEEMCASRQEAGESIWWYVCTGPKAPWPGLFIDHNAVEMRVWLWMTWKWNVEGILVWTSNWWTSPTAFPDSLQNPWEDPMGYVAGYGRPAGSIGYWGNGDGRFVYPPNKDVLNDTSPHVTGPVSSIRWAMLREGIEDFEYFALLRGLVAARPDAPQAALLEVPEEIVGSLTEFTKCPLPMYEHRERVARAIEALQGR